jgi:hypothetical protein
VRPVRESLLEAVPVKVWKLLLDDGDDGCDARRAVSDVWTERNERYMRRRGKEVRGKGDRKEKERTGSHDLVARRRKVQTVAQEAIELPSILLRLRIDRRPNIDTRNAQLLRDFLHRRCELTGPSRVAVGNSRRITGGELVVAGVGIDRRRGDEDDLGRGGVIGRIGRGDERVDCAEVLLEALEGDLSR